MNSNRYNGRTDRFFYQAAAIIGHLFSYVYGAFRFDQITLEGHAMQQGQ